MLPSGNEKRKQYNDLINRAVQLHREIEVLKDDLNQLKQEVEEDIGKDFAKEFPKLAKVKFQNGKIAEDAKKKLEMLSELEILANLESGDVSE